VAPKALPSLKKAPDAVKEKENSPPIIDLSISEEEIKLEKRLEEIREMKLKLKPILDAIHESSLPYNKVLEYLQRELLKEQKQLL
jgi:hypothetical protein